MSNVLEIVVTVTGAAVMVGGIFVWWVSRILNFRKEIIELQMKVSYLEKENEEIKRDIDNLQNRRRG